MRLSFFQLMILSVLFLFIFQKNFNFYKVLKKINSFFLDSVKKFNAKKIKN